MDTLVRLRLRPLGAWTTPWQADSLLGAVAVTWARAYGVGALMRDLIEPWLAGEPPFVVSDAPSRRPVSGPGNAGTLELAAGAAQGDQEAQNAVPGGLHVSAEGGRTGPGGQSGNNDLGPHPHAQQHLACLRLHLGRGPVSSSRSPIPCSGTPAWP